MQMPLKEYVIHATQHNVQTFMPLEQLLELERHEHLHEYEHGDRWADIMKRRGTFVNGQETVPFPPGSSFLAHHMEDYKASVHYCCHMETNDMIHYHKYLQEELTAARQGPKNQQNFANLNRAIRTTLVTCLADHFLTNIPEKIEDRWEWTDPNIHFLETYSQKLWGWLKKHRSFKVEVNYWCLILERNPKYCAVKVPEPIFRSVCMLNNVYLKWKQSKCSLKHFQVRLYAYDC